MFNLIGKVAVVTGSARGIGQSIAIELARHGADVVVSDILDCKETVAQIQKLKRKAIFIKADMSKEKDIIALISKTIKQFKKIDILVNNAGIYIASPTLKETSMGFDKTININTRGYFLAAREALKYMAKKKSGVIINIASVAGLRGFAQSAVYCASKGAIIALTKALAVEFGKQGIRINSICPGIIDTAMTKNVDRKSMVAKVPLARIGLPKDIAGAAVFLASDAASYITGHDLVVDGGWIVGL